MRSFVVSSLVLLAACSPGPGRPALVPPDAQVATAKDARFDASFEDAAVRLDAAAADAGPQDVAVGLPDAEALPSFPFTGVYGILGAAQGLFAREVSGRLHVVIGDFPYSYIGSISSNGQVDLISPELQRAGCLVARITGSYNRADATYILAHETCSTQGTPVASTIAGGFDRNFEPARSGIYEVEITVTRDLTNCFDGPRGGHSGKYGISFLTSGEVGIFTASDIIAEGSWYRGRAVSEDWAFSAMQTFSALPGALVAAMSGSFQQISVNDPVRIQGVRDVIQAQTPLCTFEVQFSGERVEQP